MAAVRRQFFSGEETMTSFQYKDVQYELDEQGCLLEPAAWTRDFAEGMARECEIPVLSSEHWDVIQYVREAYEKTGVCPTIFAACKSTGLTPQEMQKLFPSGYHRGLCRVAGIHYRVSHMPYGAHLRESMADMRALSADKAYATDARGFLVDPTTWDENFAAHRANGATQGAQQQFLSAGSIGKAQGNMGIKARTQGRVQPFRVARSRHQQHAR